MRKQLGNEQWAGWACSSLCFVRWKHGNEARVTVMVAEWNDMWLVWDKPKSKKPCGTLFWSPYTEKNIKWILALAESVYPKPFIGHLRTVRSTLPPEGSWALLFKKYPLVHLTSFFNCGTIPGTNLSLWQKGEEAKVCVEYHKSFFFVTTFRDWFLSLPPEFISWSPNLSVTIFGDNSYEVVKVQWGPKSEVLVREG